MQDTCTLYYEILDNQLDDSKLFIGPVTASEIQKRLQNGGIASEKVNSAVRNFYTAAVSYIIK